MAWWVAVGGLGALLLRRVALGYPRPARRHRVLLRGEALVLAAAAEAMYPPGGPIPSSGRQADIPSYVDRLMVASHPRIRILMHLLIFLVEHATLIFPAPGHRGLRRFSSLTAAQQVAVLDAWANSPLFPRRLVFTSLRALCTFGYFAHAPVLRKLGVAPRAIESPLCEADLLYPRIGALPESIRHRPADVTAPVEDAAPLGPTGPSHPSMAGP